MIDKAFLEVLNYKGDLLAHRWKDRIRKAPELKQYNSKTDDELIALNTSMYAQLARFLERGLDRSILGSYFVSLGKDRQKKGYPISETVLGVNIARQVVIETLENETMLDNPLKLYQAIATSSDVAEFFFLGCFYLTKGELEAIYEDMNAKDNMSEDFLKKYFKDDFFFKKKD